MAQAATDVGTPAPVAKGRVPDERPPGGARQWMSFAFLGPALLLLGAFVVYPTIDTILQSVQSDEGGYLWRRPFIGFDNYSEIVDNANIRTAIKNNFIWVATAPAIITGLGLMFAILTERVKYSTAIKVIVFMPMAISFLATGVIWRVMYDDDPNLGFINASIKVATDRFGGAGDLPTAVAPPEVGLEKTGGGAIALTETIGPGDVALLGLTGISEDDVPDDAVQAAEPEVPEGSIGVVVWRDFKPGGGEAGVVESEELGLPGADVQLLQDGNVVAEEETGPDGTAVFSDISDGSYTAQIAASNFDVGFTGVRWFRDSLVTPAIIGAFCWMWAGFAVVVIGAGLAALPRDVLEAARVDGATEWQTFRHVTLPLLAPVLGVVFVTMIINVLKIFDIVYVMAPGDVQDDANVIALEMYRTAFTAREYGLGSAIAVLLFILVIPVMWLNIRRFRRDN